MKSNDTTGKRGKVYMLIDFHAHTSGISRCCRIAAAQVLQEAKKAGLDGIVLTNHYQSLYVEQGDVMGLVRRYMDEIHATQRLAEEMGLRCFWGIEVTAERYPGVHLLVYGVQEDFLYKHPLVYDMTHEQLWDTVKAEGGVLIHAHPFRGQGTPMDLKLLDGVEINCHPLYGNTYSRELLETAQEHSLLVTCGGDYHADTYRPRCGVYLPDSIRDSLELGQFLRKTNRMELLIQEIHAENPVRVCYEKGS